MPKKKIKSVLRRQAATCNGLKRRVRDLGLQHVSDPRVAGKVDYPLPTMLTALVVSMATMARSLRAVEQRTGQMAHKHGRWMGVQRRIADNTFGKVLPRLEHGELVGCLHRLVKAEHRRGNLKPTRLKRGTVAIDGKNVVTLHWPDMLRVLGLRPDDTTVAQGTALFAKRYPQAQVCIPENGAPYALVRVPTVTLVSGEAAVCVHQRPIAGRTNEYGEMPALLRELKAAFGKTRLFSVVTTDAGNTSCGIAGQAVALGLDYFMQIKSTHGDIHSLAEENLKRRRPGRAHASYTDTQNGQVVTYHLWRDDLTAQGWLDWTHARQLVRIRRTTECQRTGNVTVGNRYYVTSLSPDVLSAASALTTCRAHWRCENNTHWTADAELMEDRRRPAWSRHPQGSLVVSVLRMMALSILAVARKLSRLGYSAETPSWGQVAEHFLLELCGSILETKAFDTV
jgi:predicted transposase YbfD/YdcC